MADSKIHETQGPPAGEAIPKRWTWPRVFADAALGCGGAVIACVWGGVVVLFLLLTFSDQVVAIVRALEGR